MSTNRLPTLLLVAVLGLATLFIGWILYIQMRIPRTGLAL